MVTSMLAMIADMVADMIEEKAGMLQMLQILRMTSAAIIMIIGAWFSDCLSVRLFFWLQPNPSL